MLGWCDRSRSRTERTTFRIPFFLSYHYSINWAGQQPTESTLSPVRLQNFVPVEATGGSWLQHQANKAHSTVGAPFVAHCQLHTLRLADWFFPPGYLWVTCFLSANGLEGRGARCGREGEPLQNITGYSRSAMWKRSQVDWSARDKRAPRAAAPIRRRSRSSERGSGWPLPSLPVHLCSTNAFHLTPLG